MRPGTVVSGLPPEFGGLSLSSFRSRRRERDGTAAIRAAAEADNNAIRKEMAKISEAVADIKEAMKATERAPRSYAEAAARGARDNAVPVPARSQRELRIHQEVNNPEAATKSNT